MKKNKGASRKKNYRQGAPTNRYAPHRKKKKRKETKTRKARDKN
jgi:hypothetical protein